MARFGFRLLDSGPGRPAWNMAVDEVLLLGAEARPTLRLYAWDPAALSIGWFQRAEEAPALGLPLVRRLTGGGAVVHRDELTYAVAAPIAFFGEGAGVKASYARIHRAIGEALAAVGAVPDAPAAAPAGAPARGGAFLCYDRRSDLDIRAGGRKLVGSAQRRRGRTILQHGSIPLGAAPNAPDGTTASLAAGRPIAYHEMACAVARAFARALDLDLAAAPLAAAERDHARALARRYEEAFDAAAAGVTAP
jgi:lipoate-protein ligase A